MENLLSVRQIRIKKCCSSIDPLGVVNTCSHKFHKKKKTENIKNIEYVYRHQHNFKIFF